MEDLMTDEDNRRTMGISRERIGQDVELRMEDIATAGRTLTRQTFRFVNSKSESLFLQRKNPRKIAWTQVYRRCVIGLGE
jgi:hypothetical protein